MTPTKSPEQPSEPEPLLLFRNVCPTDLARIYALEKASYPSDENATRAQIQYRQHHAASFFRCAVLLDPQSSLHDKIQVNTNDIVTNTSNDNNVNGSTNAKTNANANTNTSSNTNTNTSSNINANANDTNTISTVGEDNRNSLNGIGQIIGFITATRCHTFDEESMKTHNPSGKFLAIHSVVVDNKYRSKGIGSRMMANYLKAVEQLRTKLKYPIEKVVLISKMKHVGFYLKSGFGVLGKSKICHGKEDWYDCELILTNLQKDIPEKQKTYEYWVMDSFSVTNAGGMVGISPISTSGKGTGNPAGVVLITDGGHLTANGDADEFDPALEDNQEWMKIVAREFNLSETAFIWEKKSGDSLRYGIRYYTCNGTEVDLCGHATLAASSVVCEKLAGRGKRDVSVTFHANNDVLEAKPAANGSGSSKIIMKFPLKETVPLESGSEAESAAKNMIRESLFSSLSEKDFDSVICHVGVDDGGDDLLVEVTADAFLSMPRSEDCDLKPMKAFDGYNRGVIICCVVPEDMKERGEKADFFSRFFGPKVGIDEDPVTGSAHCVLGPYFGKKLEKDFIVGSQRSERGGIVECTLRDDGKIRITGVVTKAMSGTLFL